MTEAEYDKLPVVYWKEILGADANRPQDWTRRPRMMHRSLNLGSLCWWIEKLFGLPRQSLRFVNGHGDPIDSNRHYDLTVKQIYNSYHDDIIRDSK